MEKLNLPFIEYNPKSTYTAVRSYNQSARGHASKVSKKRVRITKANATTLECLTSGSSLSPTDCQGDTSEASSQAASNGRRPANSGSRSVIRRARAPQSAAGTPAFVIDESQPSSPAPLTPSPLQLWRTLSPVFGGLATQGFDPTDYLAATRIVHEVFNGILPKAYSVDDIATLFEACCRHPLVFYSYAYARLWYRDHTQGPISGSDRKKMLQYSVAATKLLQQKLEALSEDDFDPVLQSMALMMRVREDLEGQETWMATPLVIPHMPWAECVDATRAGWPEGFLAAIESIINRAGGLSALKRASLVRSLCMADLQDGCNNFTAPLFASDWSVAPSIWQQNGLDTQSVEFAALGRGFSDRSLQGLPAQAVDMFISLSRVDKVMEKARSMKPEDPAFFAIIDARNAVSHGLLSLQPAQGFSSDDGRKGDLFLYECCRLASILYVNTVIRPARPNSRGIVGPTQELRTLFDSCWRQDREKLESPAATWALCVGGLGSHATQHWTGFAELIRRSMQDERRLAYEDVRLVLGTFAWSGLACDDGLFRLCHAAQSLNLGTEIG